MLCSSTAPRLPLPCTPKNPHSSSQGGPEPSLTLSMGRGRSWCRVLWLRAGVWLQLSQKGAAGAGEQMATEPFPPWLHRHQSQPSCQVPPHAETRPIHHPRPAGHGWARSSHIPDCPSICSQTLGTRGSSAPSPAPRQGAMSPAHTIVTPHVIYSAEVPLGSPPCPASIPLMGTVAVENSGSGGMQPHRAIWGCWQCHTLCHGDKPWWHLPG